MRGEVEARCVGKCGGRCDNNRLRCKVPQGVGQRCVGRAERGRPSQLMGVGGWGLVEPAQGNMLEWVRGHELEIFGVDY